MQGPSSHYFITFMVCLQTDEAWNYYAGAAEMAALAQFMQVRWFDLFQDSLVFSFYNFIYNYSMLKYYCIRFQLCAVFIHNASKDSTRNIIVVSWLVKRFSSI